LSRRGSIDLARPRSVRQVFGATLALYLRYPLLFLILAAGVVVPYDLLSMAITGVGPLAFRPHVSFTEHLPLELLSFSLVGPLVSALHMHAVALIGEGRRPRIGEVAKRGLQVLPLVAAAEIVVNLGLIVGYALLIIPGLVLSVRWAVVAQVAAAERSPWRLALARSARLGSGRYAGIFGILAVLGVATLAIRAGVALADGGWTLNARSTSVTSVALGMLVNVVTASFAALTLAILYFDLRAREDQPAAQPRRAPPRAYEHLRDLD
jgi:hypothetical protein